MPDSPTQHHAHRIEIMPMRLSLWFIRWRKASFSKDRRTSDSGIRFSGSNCFLRLSLTSDPE